MRHLTTVSIAVVDEGRGCSQWMAEASFRRSGLELDLGRKLGFNIVPDVNGVEPVQWNANNIRERVFRRLTRDCRSKRPPVVAVSHPVK